MFLENIATLRLLKCQPETGIVGRFPFHVRKSLIADVTTESLSPACDPELLSTMANVYWCMEVIGQGFALPLDDVALIGNSVSLYTQWLVDSEKRPKAIRNSRDTEDEQRFWQTVFQHFSLLYASRSNWMPAKVADAAAATSTARPPTRRQR